MQTPQQILVAFEHIQHDIPMRKLHQNLLRSAIDSIISNHHGTGHFICEYVRIVKMHR